MQEPKMITIGDVIDSTAKHINKGNPLFARESKGNPHGTQGEPSNRANSDLLTTVVVYYRKKMEFAIFTDPLLFQVVKWHRSDQLKY